MIFSIYQEKKQLRNAAVKLTNLVLLTVKEFSCVREYCGSEKDTMTATAFCQSRLFSPTHASDRDRHTISEV